MFFLAARLDGIVERVEEGRGTTGEQTRKKRVNDGVLVEEGEKVRLALKRLLDDGGDRREGEKRVEERVQRSDEEEDESGEGGVASGEKAEGLIVRGFDVLLQIVLQHDGQMVT